MRWLPRRRKAALEFELQPRSRPAASGWLLLAVACAFAADVAWSYADVSARTGQAMRKLAALPATRAEAVQILAYRPKDVDRESAFARGVITKISLPWNDLFKALGATQIEEVQLLGVEPDAKARTVRITAEARDVPAMLTYVARLESQGYFRSVGLLQHELKREGPDSGAAARRAPPAARPAAPSSSANAVSFVVGASWKQK